MYLLLGSAALFVAALPFDEHAQASPSAIPDNARQRSYGWDCNRGFRETAGNCVAVIVPANAYLSPEGTSWTCNRGFRPEGAACKAVQAPANAYVVDTRYDRGWQCNRGYRPVDQSCVQLAVPAHAYAVESSYGPDGNVSAAFASRRIRAWRSQFRPMRIWWAAAMIGSASEASAASASAATRSPFPQTHISTISAATGAASVVFAGKVWAALLLRVPDHGFINYSGDDWSCEEGFRKERERALPRVATTLARVNGKLYLGKRSALTLAHYVLFRGCAFFDRAMTHSSTRSTQGAPWLQSLVWLSSAIRCRVAAESRRSLPTCSRRSPHRAAMSETAIVAMNDQGRAYDYPPVVQFQIDAEEPDAYARAADFLNTDEFDVACLQHEFGIFGGEAGGHIVGLLSRLNMPIVTTLHTVLAKPSARNAPCSSEIVEVSAKIIVMAEKGAELLRSRVRRAAGQDRSHSARHSRLRLRRARRGEAATRVRRPASHPHFRPALAEQGHRGDDRCDAGDSRAPPRCGLCRARRNASESRSPRGRGLSRKSCSARARARHRGPRRLSRPVRRPARRCSTSSPCATSTSRLISTKRR